MKREDRNLLSRQRILHAALREFGEKGYDKASLNAVCSDGDISKGIIYHYFQDKDAVYLACVKDCFDALTTYLRAHVCVQSGQVEQGLQIYFSARLAFFDTHPAHLPLFCGAVILPPAHLLPRISQIRADFDAFNRQLFHTLLDGVALRDDLTIDEVIETLGLYQDFFHARNQLDPIRTVDLKAHEAKCHRALRILLYGVLKQESLS